MSLIKIFGWLLLVSGLLIIAWTLYSSYQIFTGKTTAPQIFKIQAKEVKPPFAKNKTPTTQAEIQEETKKMIGEQLQEMIPIDAVPKLLNLISWSILAGILIFGGGQIAGLGIKLLKG
jgi:hypothetical protein